MKKILAVLLACAIALIVPGGLAFADTSCSALATAGPLQSTANPVKAKKYSKHQKSAVKFVKRFMKSVKQYDVGKMKSAFQKAPKDYFFRSDTYMYRKCKSQNKKLKYKILGVTASKNTAKVRMKVKYKDGYDGYIKAFKKYENWVYSYSYRNGRVPSDGALKRVIEKYLAKYVGKYGFEACSEKISIKLKKVGGNWRIKGKPTGIEDMSSLGYSYAYREYWE